MIGDKRGLTLMELLVVLGVFSLTVAMASAIFIQSNRAQRRVLSLTSAQADLRFALESIVHEVRGGQIDYAAYASSSGISIPTDRLYVKSADGDHLEFYAETNPTVCPVGVAKCLAVKVGGVPQSVTSTGVLLENLTFYVSPQTDPFLVDEATGLYTSDQQPLVTVAMRIRTGGSKTEDPAELDAQTTVASRTYAR